MHACFSMDHDYGPQFFSYTCVSCIAGRDDSLKSQTCVDLVNNCPNLTSLALRGFKLHDYKVRILVKVYPAISRIHMPQSHMFLTVILTLCRNILCRSLFFSPCSCLSERCLDIIYESKTYMICETLIFNITSDNRSYLVTLSFFFHLDSRNLVVQGSLFCFT